MKITSKTNENTYNELINFAKFIGLEQLAHGRYSSLFAHQLFDAFRSRSFSPARIIKEINALENSSIISHTKQETMFKGPHLNGLWHKHYEQSGLQSMAINLKKGLKRYGMPWFEEQIKKNEASGEDKYITTSDINSIVHDIVLGHWQRLHHDRIMTGEWIIFAKYNEKNYYLSLGDHTSDDMILRKMIDEWCIEEFPFILDILPSNN